MRMDTIFAAIPAAIAVSFLAAREAWRMWAPARHLLAGNYTEARESAEAFWPTDACFTDRRANPAHKRRP